MAVPDNFTFSLSDVVNEIGCAGNLQACISGAAAGFYDPAYSGEVGLRRFRNYGPRIYANYTLLFFDYMDGNPPCGYINVYLTANGSWTGSWNSGGTFSCWPMSGAAGTTTLYFSTNMVNWNPYDLYDYIIFTVDGTSVYETIYCDQYQLYQSCS